MLKRKLLEREGEVFEDVDGKFIHLKCIVSIEKNKVVLIVFGSEIRTALEPTDKLKDIIHEITKVKALQQTNIEKSIEKATEMFSNEDFTKHFILITDVLPTEGS